MKQKPDSKSVVQDLCRQLKIQLDSLSVEIDRSPTLEEKARRSRLMEQLKEQLAELSR